MVRQGGRNDFTESDDYSLVKYIAHVKPQNSGRLGKNLYIDLEESADLRPWAKGHSWQSWRERYKRNQVWFDYKIKKYQKKVREEETQPSKKPERDPSVVNGNNNRTMDKGGEAQATHKKPERDSTVVNENNKRTVDKGEEAQASRKKSEHNSTVVNGNNKRTMDKGEEAEASRKKPERDPALVNGNNKSTMDKEGEAQATRKKSEYNSTVVNGNNITTMEKGKSKSDADKLVQAPTDKPEKGKYNGHASAISLVACSTSVPTAVQVSSTTERKVPVSALSHSSSSSSSSLSESEDQDDNEEESITETEDREELYEELFGVSQISEDRADETLDGPERSLVPSSSNVNQENIYRLENVSQPGTVDKKLHTPGSFDIGAMNVEAKKPIRPRAQEPSPKSVMSSGRKSPATGAIIARQLTHIHDKPRKKILSRDDDSNFFGTPSPSPLLAPSPSPSPSPAGIRSIAKGKPPILVEGPYRSSFKRIRATSGNVTNDESWPPKRRKKDVEDIDMTSPDVEMSDVGNARGRVEMRKAVVPLTSQAAGSTNRQARLRSPAQVNAVASSSKVLLPDPPPRHAKPTNLLKTIYAKATPASDTSYKNDSLANSLIQTAANNGPKSVHIHAAPDTKSTLVIDKKKHDERVTSSSARNSVAIEPMRRLIATPNSVTSLQLTRISSVDTDDPFIAKQPLIKGKTSASSPVENLILHDKPPRIDLRQSLNNHVTRRSSHLNSRASTSSTSGHSVTPFLPEDQEMINRVGFPGVMAVIAKHYGFDVDVAMNAFFATKSIDKTKAVLQHAKDVANSATSLLLAQLVNQGKEDDVDSYGDEEPQRIRHARSSSSGRDQSSSSGHQKANRSLGSRKPKRPSLNIKPQSFDEEIDQLTLSDYSPPHVSRAGQFNRLVKQGRREEAVDRERRRASGVPVVQTQVESYEDQRQKSLSLMPNSSPTLNSTQEPMDIDSCHDDDSELPIATPDKDIVQHQPPDDDVSLPIDHHRIFIKRISEGRSTLNEDEDDPAILKLAQEHRNLVKNVTEDNADGLRSFELKNNQDLLRLWSLDWARQKIADIE